ncbi:MAG: class I SAM-dependent methyltransferase, partial [Burkholderiaceae bacterium]|nr:class I SAM-dependent methyltransferase [Burkholderiaceae bacterium]
MRLSDLPQPEPPALAASQSLRARVEALIDAAGGWIGFDRYMHEALYAPGLGYYTGGARKFGAGGDFVTAPETSALFAACVAAQCMQWFER